MAANIFEFGEFKLDCGRFELSRKGRSVRLERKPLELLILLAGSDGQLVTREEIARRLWASEVFVDTEHGINTAISKIRQCLRDDPEQPRFVLTVTGKGYRFIPSLGTGQTGLNRQDHAAISTGNGASVLASTPALAEAPTPVVQQAAPEVLPTPQSPPTTLRKAWLVGIAGLVIVCAALALAYRLLQRPQPPLAISSLAVLPLDNLSGDAGQDYFADGMTDELTTELARISTLRVVSRTSVMPEKGRHRTLQQIARDLNVDAIVEGSVSRSGDKIRITAQLIDTRSDKHLWAQSFEGSSSDLLALQDNVAREIAAQTKAALASDGGARASATRRINPAAHDAYLRGRYFLEKRDVDKSVAYFQRAIDIDPQWSQAYSGLADALHAEEADLSSYQGVMTRGEAAARRAIELDPANGEAYSTLGVYQATFDWNWTEAERNIRRGIALNPNSADAELDYAVLLDILNRPEEAVTHMRRALELDPQSFLMNRHLGATLLFARHYEEALAHLAQAAEMEPGKLNYVLSWESGVYESMGNRDKAAELDIQVQGLGDPAAAKRLRSIYSRDGWEAYRRARIRMFPDDPNQPCTPYAIASDYLRIGQPDRAFEYLNRAVDQKCDGVLWIQVSPLFDSIRSDQRYNDLLKRMNLPR
jgi:TolB-like protein/DNA-binding winged helix-turn-helix (wHTH) protein/Tfp pilus assembly protein PilF